MDYVVPAWSRGNRTSWISRRQGGIRFNATCFPRNQLGCGLCCSAHHKIPAALERLNSGRPRSTTHLAGFMDENYSKHPTAISLYKSIYLVSVIKAYVPFCDCSYGPAVPLPKS